LVSATYKCRNCSRAPSFIDSQSRSLIIVRKSINNSSGNSQRGLRLTELDLAAG
jgi:hypothetical protein